MRKLTLVVSLILVMLAIPVLAGAQVRVVASTEFLADWVRNIAGSDSKVDSLVPGMASPHSFEPTMRHITLLKNADLYVEIGLGLEPWSSKLVRSADNDNLIWLTLSDKLPPSCGLGFIEHKIGTKRYGDCNPHIWLDQQNVVRGIGVLRDKLSAIEPKQAGVFAENATHYMEQIDQIFRRYEWEISGRGLSVVSIVPTYSYLLQDLGVTEIGPLTKGHGDQPSVKDVAALVQEAQNSGALVILSEGNYDHGFGRAMAEETGLPLLYLTPLPEPGQSYLDFLKQNLERLTNALK